MAKFSFFSCINLFLGILLILTLFSCTSKKSIQQENYTRIADITNLNELVKQIQRAGPVENQVAAKILKAANEGAKIAEQEGPDAAAEHTSWAMAAKDYSESVSIKPTTEGLLGYAKAYAMSSTTLDSKLENFRKAVDIYRLTLELVDRTQKPLSSEQRQQIESQISCLESFIKKPNPKVPICQLIQESLGVGNVNH